MIFLFPNLLPKIPSCLIMKCCHTVVSVGKYKILLWYILRYSSRLVFLSSSGYVRVYGRSHDGYAQLPTGLPARQTSQNIFKGEMKRSDVCFITLHYANWFKYHWKYKEVIVSYCTNIEIKIRFFLGRSPPCLLLQAASYPWAGPLTNLQF